MGASAITVQGVLSAITTALTIGITVWSMYNAKVQQHREEIQQACTESKTYREELARTLSKVEDETTGKSDLIRINKSLSDSYDIEKGKLQEINELRGQTVDLLFEEAKAKANEYLNKNLEEYEAAKKELSSRVDATSTLTGIEAEITLMKALTNSNVEYNAALGATQITLKSIKAMQPADAIDFVNKRLSELRNKAESVEGLTVKEEVELKYLDKALEKLDDRYKENINLVDEYNENAITASQNEQQWLSTNRELGDSLDNTAESTELTKNEIAELKKQYGITNQEIQELIETENNEIDTESQAVEELVRVKQEAKEVALSYENLSKAATQLESEISSLATALAEQEKNGSIALKTQLELIDAGYASALAYNEETGACKLNEEAVKAVVEAKIQQQIANLRVAESNLTATLMAEANAAVVDANSFITLARAKNIANEASRSNSIDRGYSSSYSGYGNNGGYAVNDSETKKQYEALETEIKAFETSLKQIKNVGVKAFGTIGQSATKAGKSAGSAAKSTKDATKKAEEAKKKAIEETTQAIQKQINALDEEIAQIDKQTEAIQKQVSALEKTKSEYERVFSFITKKIEDRIKEIEAERDTAVEASEAIVKAKEEEKDTILAGIEAEISALEEAKEAREKYWDEEIDALKNKNEEYKKSLELQEKLDALEKAKNTKVKVYKKGQGFVYDVDQTEVQKAQKELDEYLKERDYEDELEKLENLKNAEIENYNTRINELNKFKDKTQKTYEEEIKNLEANTKALEQQYDEQIAIYQGYKTEFENMLNAYQNSQDELLASQLTGINFENDNWMTRIGNLQSFVDNYTAGIREIERLNEEEAKLNEEKARLAEEREELQRRLNEAKNGEGTSSPSSSDSEDIASSNYSGSPNNMSSGGGTSGYSGYISTAPTTTKPDPNWVSGKGGSGATSGNQGYTSDALDAARRKADAASQGIKDINAALKAARRRAGYASGIGYVQDDQIAVVGENPHQEIVLGSKVNNGQLMSLGKGSGVVNAKGTNTLAEILNQFGKFGASKFGQGNGVLNNNTNNESLVINGVTIQGANISDPQSFVNGLLSLKAEALQRAYKAH